MGMFKRIIAAVLVVAMMVAELPTVALAQMLEETVTVETVPESTAASEETTEAATSEPEVVPETTAAEADVTEAAVETTAGAEETEVSETAQETVPAETAGTVGPVLEETEDAALSGEAVEEIGPGIGSAEDNLSCEFDEETCVLTISGDGDMVDCSKWADYKDQVDILVIEEGVTSICEAAFADMANVHMVLLPNSLTSIGAYAFQNCTTLAEICIPADVTQIGQGAFAGCENLSFVQILGYDVTLGDDCFSGVGATVAYPYDSSWSDYGSYGGSLEWMGYARILDTGLFGIGRWTLDEYGTLQIYGIGTVAEKTSAAGYPWYEYADSVYMVQYSSLDNLPRQAFAGFKNLNTVYINDVGTVGAGAFSGCGSLKTITFMGTSEIAADAFSGVTASVCYQSEDGWSEDAMQNYGGQLSWQLDYEGTYGTGIGWIVTGNTLSVYSTSGSVESMADQTSAEGYPWYTHRDRICEVYVTNISVGDYAFDGYSNLEIAQMNYLERIGANAFRNCSALNALFFMGEPPAIAENAFAGVTATAKYSPEFTWSEAQFQNYGGTLTWSKNVYEAPEQASGTYGENVNWTLDTAGALAITGEGAMAGQTSGAGYPWYEYRAQIDSITVTGLTSVGDYAFAGDYELSEVVIGETVTSVGSHILDGCVSIDIVRFTGMPPVFAEDTFTGICSTGIGYPYSLREAWETTTENTYGGESIWWTRYVETIASGNLGNMRWQVREDGYLYLRSAQGSDTFVMSDLEEGKAPWQEYADQITYLDLDRVEVIGKNAFTGLSQVTGISFCETLSAIGENAFAGCTGLESLWIMPTVTTIGARAFADCTALAEVNFRGTVDTIGENAFRNVTADAYYYSSWDSAMMQNYGGQLNWQQQVVWIDGDWLDGIYWDLYSDGSLKLNAEELMAMPEIEPGTNYPWYSYADQITEISVTNISSISDFAFVDCTGLTDFKFDYRITELGDYIFYGCTNLSQLTFDGSAPEFSNNTFYSVTATVSYPTGDPSWTEEKRQNYNGNLTWLVEDVEEEVVYIASGSCGETVTWGLDEEYNLIISGTGAMDDYEYEGSPWYSYIRKIQRVEISDGVTAIGDNAFDDCSVMTAVSIPDSVTRIGSGAFSACCELQEIDLPDNLISLETQVFSGCTSLTTVTIPEGVTSIGDMAFMSCFDLASVTIPGSVTEIGMWAFNSCSSLTDITMQGNAPTIAEDALDGVTVTIHYPAGNETWTEETMLQYGGTVTWSAVETGGEQEGIGGSCGENLTWSLDGAGVLTISGTGAMTDFGQEDPEGESEPVQAPWYSYREAILCVEIGQGVTGIGSYAFYECSNLTEVTIPEGVTGIGTGAFAWCVNLTGITVPESVAQIGDDAFSWCRKLTDVSLTDGLTQIGAGAFRFCDSMTAVTIPYSVVTIGEKAFINCTKLTDVTIPSSVTAIGEGAFDKCTSLAGIWVASDNEHYSSDMSGVLFDKDMKQLIQAPGSLSGPYTIPGCVTHIADRAFAGCTHLYGVTIQEGMTHIGELAFEGSNITSVRIPSGVAQIGYGAFYDCADLITVTIADGVACLSENMFGMCSELASIFMEGDAPVISDTAFSGVTATVYYPGGNDTWTEAVKQQYGGTITWEEAEEDLPGGSCGEDLTWTVDGDGVLTISGTGPMAEIEYVYEDEDTHYWKAPWHDYRDQITSVVIESGVTTVEGRAFRNCGYVTEVSIPDTVESIGYEVFGMGVQTIEVAEENQSFCVEDGVLYNKEKTTLYCYPGQKQDTEYRLPGSVTEMRYYSVMSEHLEKLTIPASVTKIEENAFCRTPVSLTEVIFEGDAPDSGRMQIFWELELTAYYPQGNSTWTEEVMTQFGEGITWVPYEKLIAEGYCGAELTWKLTEDGTMTISGTGEMNDYGTNIMRPDWMYYADQVKKIVIEEGVTTVGSYAFFADYLNVTEVSLPETLVSIGDYAFSFCGITGTLTLPDSVRNVGYEAFRGCTGLTALDLGSGLETIGGYAFGGCSNIAGTVTIPATVTAMGENVFNFSNKITHIRFACVDCPEIGGNSLGSISGLKSIYVPAKNYESYAALIANLPAGVEVQTDASAFPVEGLSVSAVYSKTAVLSWKSHSSGTAVGYNVYRDNVLVGSTTQCAYTDRTLEPGTRYTYTVRASFAGGEETPDSQTVEVQTVLPKITALTGYLEYANFKLFAQTRNTVRVTVEDAGNLAPLDQQQNTLALYRSSEDEEVFIGWAQLEENGDGKTYSFVWDVSVLSDGVYTLRAVLTDVDGTTAQWTEEVTVDNTPPGKLQQVVATGSEEDIRLSWTQATEYDAAGYNIYRSVGSQEDFRWLAKIPGKTTLAFTDSTAPEDQTCYYYVVAVDIFEREATAYDIVGSSRITDTEKPRITRMQPSSGSCLTGTAVFTLKAEDNVDVVSTKLEYSLDKEQTWTELIPTEGKYVLDTTALEDGEIALRAYAYDAAKNESDAFRQSYIIDNTGPEQVTGLSHVSTSVTMTLRWEDVKDQDIGGFLVEQLLSDGSYKTVAEKVTALGVNLQGLVPNTEYTYRVTGYDIYGNLGTPSELYTASTAADTTAPVTVQLLPGSGSFRDQIVLTATVEDDSCVASAALEYSLDNILWTQLHSERYSDDAAVRKISAKLDLTDIPEGLLYVRATAVDRAGNTADQPSYVQHMVDKTAPAVPTNVTATGGSGYVELRWSAEMGAAAYQIYKAKAEDGEFVQVSAAHTYLNYVDRNVEDGGVYYYRVAALDAAGNVSQCCETVSAQASPDDQAPEILSISPADGGTLSSSFAQVSVLARDNSALASILVEYSHNGSSYATLTLLDQINAYGDIAEATVPVAEFAHGDTVYLRATATDRAGNVGQATEVTYTVDTQAPTLSGATALYEEGTVVLSWNGGDEADLAGYRIYRRNSEGTSTMIGQVPAQAGQTAYSWTDDTLPTAGGTFTYQVEAVDAVGNTATGSSTETTPGENSPVVEIPERTGPTALLVCDSFMTSGVEYIIDGSGSVDDGYIVSYEYDFGDGTKDTGKTVIHKYTTEGSYILALTVTDNDGNVKTVSRKVIVKSPDLVGQVSVRIVDEKGAPVPNAPVYFDLGEEQEVIRRTDASGYATFTAEVGRHTVGCVILNNQWLPVKRDLIVNAGETTSVSMTLINKPIVEGSFEIKRMTLEEIEAAGIDLSDPANQHYVEVVLHLEYGNAELDQTLPFGALTGKIPIIFDPFGIWKPDEEDDDEEDPVVVTGSSGIIVGGEEVRGWFVELIDKSEDPKLMILDIPIGVQSLKEMFDVRLHILNNSSSEFSMLDNVITLDTPAGLSVVTDAYMANQQTVKVAEIPGQTQKTVEWIVRGDKAGEYTLAADYSGILSQFNKPLTARFEAKEPIQVYGMDGMKLTIEVAEELEYGTLYYNVILRNEGKTDIYKPSISTEDILIEMQLYDQTGWLTAEKDGEKKTGSGLTVESLSTLPDILNVGDSLVMYYMCIDQTEYTHCVMELQEKTYDIANTYGLGDVKIVEKPLEYFRQSMNTRINANEKADLTFTTNQDAYNQIIDNRNYVYWIMANDKKKEFDLSDNADEIMWDTLKGDFIKSATDNEDTEQVKAMIVDLLTITAESVDDIKYSKQLKFLKAMREVVDGMSMTDILGDYAKSFKKALDSAYKELKSRGSLYKTGYSYALEDLIYEHWTTWMLDEDLKVLDKASSYVKMRKLLADEEGEKVWKKVGLSIKAIKKLQSLTENILLDIEWILEAQAKEDAMLVCMSAMINNFTLGTHLNYQDSGDVHKCLIDMKQMLEKEGIAYAIISNIVDMVVDIGIEHMVGKGTKVVMEMVGGSGDPLTWFVIKTVNLSAAGIDMLTNLSEQQDMADQIRFAAMLSDTARKAVINARNVYKNDTSKSPENAARYMQLLKLLINLRAIGESQVALYGKSFETAFTVGNLPLLKVVRAKTDAKEATSWYQWRDIVEDRISRLKVQLLRNPLSTEVTGRDRPTVSFDYVNGQTLQSFDESFAYSLDKGETWIPCDGSPIQVEAPEISVELWVRKIDTSNTDMTETGSVTIYGAQSVEVSEIEVLKTPDGYRIDGLDPEKSYQVTFSAEAMDYNDDTVLAMDLPEGSYSYTYASQEAYRYVYIRAKADRNAYASDIAQINVVNTVRLITFVTGEGLVMDHETVWEYGDEVSVTAVPAENRFFDGWYRGGVKVSSSATYTFGIYATTYLEARFLEADEVELPGVSGYVDPLAGTADVELADGTTVNVSGIPREAFKLVVETVTEDTTLSWITECLENTGMPVQTYDIYLLDDRLERMDMEGMTVSVAYSGETKDMILCGIREDGEVTVLQTKAEEGTLTFTANDSDLYVLTGLLPDRCIELETSADELLPGEMAQLNASFEPGNPTGTQILWSLAEGDDMYVVLKPNGSSATLTARKVTGGRDVTVTASAADGSFPSTAVQIQIQPYVYQLLILADEEDVTGKKINFDINGADNTIQLTSLVAPEDASKNVTWQSSNEDIAEVTEDGLVTFLDQTGEVKITVTAADGSGKSVSVTFNAVALVQNVEMADDSVTELVGGKSAKFQALDADTGAVLTKSQLRWSLDEEYAPYATISADGVLKTRTVAEETTIVITGRVVGNEENGVVEHAVILLPEATFVELRYEDRPVNGETLRVDTEGFTEDDLPYIELEAIVYPGDAMEDVTWKVKEEKIASVDQNGVVTVKWDAKKGVCKTGTVTVTATAKDGSKVAGSAKVQFGVFVKDVEIEAPDFELRSGKKMTLTAQTTPAKPTKSGVTWSLVGEGDSGFATISSSGKLTAKTVYEEHTVKVRATAKDGSGVYEEVPVLILPKKDGILTIHTGGKNVTKSSVSVNLNSTNEILLEAKTLGETYLEDVTWKSSSKKIATVTENEDGTVTVKLNKTGGATITATAEDGRTATVTVKGVRLTEAITVSSKSGVMTVASGKSLTLAAAVAPSNATNKKVSWAVAPKDAEYATISSSGKLTAAKNLLAERTIEIIVTAKDGGAQQTAEVLLTPLATGISILLDEDTVINNTTQVHNMAEGETLTVAAAVYPLKHANEAVVWKSSNKKIASISKDGEITCKKSGTVTITATAADGSKVKASFKLKVEKWMTELTLPDTAAIAGGKTLTMTKLKDYFVDPYATNKTVIWSMEGEGAAYATLSSKGVLKTNTVTEPKTLTVTATAADGGECSADCTVTIYPATTKVKILCEGEAVTKTLTLAVGEELDLDGSSLPFSAADSYTWKSSSSKYAKVDADGVVTADKAGKTISISCLAADGSGKSAVVKIKIVKAD